MDLKEVKQQAKNDIKKAQDLKALDLIYKKYLGKQGEIVNVFSGLKDLPEQERRQAGKEANLAKQEIEKMLEQKTAKIKQRTLQQGLEKEKIDITRPGVKLERGHLHLITQVQRELTKIFESMGFEVVLGPEIETEWYNFDALNVPKDHPARDMQDTFWLQGSQKVSNPKSEIPARSAFGAADAGGRNPKQISNSKFQKSEKLLLRTHTSPVQIRYMETHKPPLRIVVPGRVFRNEATDSKHEAQFYQLEGLMVDKDVSAANFKAIAEEFLSRYFGSEVKVRLRPGFFPFVEPGFEIDAQRSDGKWLELMGAGMVHPNVFKSVGLEPNEWHGFAFGCGIERLIMLKYNIPDLRMFYQSDLRFLKQF